MQECCCQIHFYIFFELFKINFIPQRIGTLWRFLNKGHFGNMKYCRKTYVDYILYTEKMNRNASFISN